MSTFYEAVWEYWTPNGVEGPPCILCYAPAVTLHEIKPRSRHRQWQDDPWNSVPICASCHETVQASTEGWESRLTEARNRRVQATYDWKGTRTIMPEGAGLDADFSHS